MDDDSADALAELAKELRRLHAATNLTMDGLAQRSGIGRTTLSQAFNGALPTERTVTSIALALGVKDPKPLLDLRDRADTSRSNGPQEPKNSVLSIDDVIVTVKDWKTSLDVRVRNHGKSTINITQALISIIERVRLNPAAYYEVSAGYDLFIDSEHNSVAVSHVLAPGEVDRFSLLLGFSEEYELCEISARLILIYNGGLPAVSDLKFRSLI
jgi:transcriptional regulator with XRE-family HTH domain